MDHPPLAPDTLAPPSLRALAARALRVDRLEVAAEALAPTAGADPFAGLRAAVLARLAAEDAALAEDLERWLAADPENGPVLTLATFVPWREPTGHWRRDVPHWVRVLATHAGLALAIASCHAAGW